MKMTTGIIRYNLKDRMRQYNGQERHFNIPKLVASINSNQVQERVKLGDLHGFYGHWARVKFGAEPQEGGIIDGKIINLEPCFRTTHLKAYDDGTVEHQAEFFDNEPGRKGFALLESKAGGFSSVISMNNGEYFHGFDVVREPNFSGNRPYTLDSSTQTECLPSVMVLDDVKTEENQLQAEYIAFLLDDISQLQRENEQLRQENQQLNISFHQIHAENDLLLDDILILKEKKQAEQDQKRFNSIQLDDAIEQAEAFKHCKLENLDFPEDKAQTKYQQLERQLSQYLGD